VRRHRPLDAPAALVWDVDTLVLARAGDWHAVWESRLPDGEHYGWYVNLQQPFRRTDLGLETMDLALDLIVEPDRSWRWKDEDELELFVERGAFAPELPQRLRREALEVVGRAERNEPPFSEPWPEWQPDPAWERPTLPDGWERPQR
jgi:protein associated with RNAse G/E